MGCLKLTYDQTFPLLKVAHSDFSAKEKKMNRFFISEEKSSAGKYSYGYQGSEKDDEIKGSGNSYTSHFRQLDPRLGKWLSIDPKASSMPWQSPYCSMDNNPIWFNDPLGDQVEGDYKDIKTGEKLGSDGKKDNKIHLIDKKDFDNVEFNMDIEKYAAELSKYVKQSNNVEDVDNTRDVKLDDNLYENKNPITSDFSTPYSVVSTIIDQGLSHGLKYTPKYKSPLPLGSSAPLKLGKNILGTFGGLLGAVDNGFSSYDNYQKENYVQSGIDGVQAAGYTAGTGMLFSPVAPAGGVVLIVVSATDVIELGWYYFTEK